ncbi:MAG: hypothetical protein BroJett030_29300 [Alphaproteobacteria bacterium]|nr:MAG: hypothetical protein BroJett030_29300 [Alphaproteobacteria bacterium]
MPLKRIRIELARDSDYPQGSRNCGYEFVAPLDATGRMDPDEWRQHRSRCQVTRFWEGEKPELGHLVRKPGGTWAFHYDVFGDEDDDETGYRFGQEKFVVGEYVSIREHDDKMRTFKVVSVADG